MFHKVIYDSTNGVICTGSGTYEKTSCELHKGLKFIYYVMIDVSGTTDNSEVLNKLGRE